MLGSDALSSITVDHPGLDEGPHGVLGGQGQGEVVGGHRERGNHPAQQARA